MSASCDRLSTSGRELESRGIVRPRARANPRPLPGRGTLVKPIISFERAVGGTWAAAAPAWPARFAPLASRLLIGLIWLAAYVVLEWVSFIHDYKGLPVTPWNPGLGAVLALMILGGAPYALVLFAGVLIAELVVLKSSLDWPVVLGIAA